MKINQIIGIVLLIAGFAAIAFGGFSYVSDTHEANLGPMHLQVQEHKQVNIPLWVGGAAIVVGVVLLVRRS